MSVRGAREPEVRQIFDKKNETFSPIKYKGLWIRKTAQKLTPSERRGTLISYKGIQMVVFKSFLSISLTCFALSACSGSGGVTPAVTAVVNSVDGLGGSADQPFAQRLNQTPYPSGLLSDQEAMKRVLGEDKDGNGIRDDVDNLIAAFAADVNEKKAYAQYARGLQAGFKVRTKIEAQTNNALMLKALQCQRKIFKEKTGQPNKNQALYDQKLNFLKKIEQLTVNTVERVLRSDEVDLLSQGLEMSVDPASNESQACDQ